MNAKRSSNAIRITGGYLRGRAIFAPEGLHVRPMRSRIRESLFSILAPHMEGCRFLDVFSGSGAIGIEAISRGARDAVFVENHPPVLANLRRNFDDLGLTSRVEIQAINPYQQTPTSGPFDVVFLDPPFPDYDREEGSPWHILESWLEQRVLASDGVLGMEFPKWVDPPTLANVGAPRVKKYGNTRLALWEL